jgi:hypothetical protein
MLARRIARSLAVAILALAGFGYWYMMRCRGSWDGVPLEAQPRYDLPAIAAELRKDVSYLSETLGPRNPRHPEALLAAEAWIRVRWKNQGYQVRAQSLEEDGVTTANLEIELPGTERPEEIVILSAQYDSWPETPGANNNASGMAVLLKLGELLRGYRPDRTLRLVAFTLQEPPYEELGSQLYAARSRARKEQVRVMLSMDAIGIYRQEPGTQKLPFPFSLFYPTRGNFLGFIGDLESRPYVVEATRGFRKGSAFPIEAGAVPRWVKGAAWSDHESFWNVGYHAIQVTDTGASRSPSHTTAEDTIDKIDFTALARVTLGMYGAILELTTTAKS